MGCNEHRENEKKTEIRGGEAIQVGILNNSDVPMFGREKDICQANNSFSTLNSLDEPKRENNNCFIKKIKNAKLRLDNYNEKKKKAKMKETTTASSEPQNKNSFENKFDNEIKKKELKNNDKEQIKALLDKNKLLENEIKNLRLISNDNERKLNLFQRENNQLKEEKSRLIKDNQDRIEQMEKSFKELKSEYHSIFQDNEKNKKLIADYKNDYNKILNLKKENDDLKIKLNDCQKLQEKYRQLNEKYQQLKIEKETFREKCEFLRNQSKEKVLDKTKYENLSKKYNELKEKYEELIPITVGLDNVGATCYMNATLQCFSSVSQLTGFFLKKYNYDPNDKNKKMSNEYYKVVKNLWDIKRNKKSYAPQEFKDVLSEENPLFAGINANDSKDLVNFLLERFHQELNDIKNKNNVNIMLDPNDQLFEYKMLNAFLDEMKCKYNSPISDLFYGIIETKSQCTNCKQIKYNFQIFSFLEFPLEEVNKYCYSIGKRANFKGIGNPDIDLYECFEQYQLILTMSGDNQLYCNNCNKSYDGLYGTTLYSMPNYLIINLNRGKGAIYQCKVNFPEILQLYNYVSFKEGNTIFQLQAVICHLGPSSMSGHFIAFCRHYKNNKWYKYNDSFVEYCENQHEYRTGMPYILFYKALK